MEDFDSRIKPHAITIRVNDLYKWFDMIVRMENSSRLKILYHGEELLGPKWIYRGQANSGWGIASSFERLILSAIPKELKDDEAALRMRERASILYFQQWADIPKQEAPDLNSEWLALMRHYDVPTRLIDFSEVPLIALAFALEDDTQKESDFAIWAVLGGSYVDEVKRQIRREVSNIEILDTLTTRARCDEIDRKELNSILSGCDDVGPRLLRYVPLRVNDRQKRQRGLFLASTHLSRKFMPLLHEWTGTDENDLQDANFEIYIGDAFASDEFIESVANAHIIKYVFDKKLRDNAKSFLHCCNITDFTRYGGMEKLAMETKALLVEGFYR